MADEWKEYVNDPRTVCKYATNCYQKNPEHHQKFKHPPQKTRKDVNRNKRRFSPYTRDSPRHSPNPRGADESTGVDSKASPYTRDSPRHSPNPRGADESTGVDSKASPYTKDSPRHSPNPRGADESTSVDSKVSPYTRDSPCHSPTPRGADESTSGDSKEKAANDDNDNKPEDLEVSKPKPDEHIAVDFPETITYYDKSTDNSILKELFLVEMPEDFFKFFECISDCGKTVENTLASVNLVPIGPYELLLGKLPKLDNKELYLIHWRFFYDPPEFQAVLKKKKNSEYHIGYFRDDPVQKPVFVASNDSAKGYHITPMAHNIFGAVYMYLQNEKKHSPFTAMSCQKLMDKIKTYAEKNNISMEEFSMKKRLAHMVTRSFHGAGIVVPYNKKTQIGYRHLVETDANLKKLFASLEKATDQNEKEKLLSDLQPVITYASIAVDESDFGTGLEVGIALFCSGLKELEPSAMNSLSAAYSVLNRSPFGEIIQAHLKYRRKGPNVSLLHLK